MTDQSPRGPFTRRRFLIGGGVAAASAVGMTAPFFFKRKQVLPPGEIVGGASSLGHRLRTRDVPEPSHSEAVDAVIVGGGIAGLSAARRLEKRGVAFKLLELESAVGGNSSYGTRGRLKYPWGAHYIPLVSAEAREVKEFFHEIGVIEKFDGQGRPHYREEYLCAEPQERLYLHGKWQDGLIPQFGVPDADKREYDSFFAEVEKLKKAKGKDGRPLFAIPLARSSQDAEWKALDRITFKSYLDSRGWRSPFLVWYTDYCCRDDYGAGIETVSAWAGLHYFASRSGTAANADSSSVLTWPEGNGWIVEKLRTPHGNAHTESRSLVNRVKKTTRGWNVEYWNDQTQQSKRLEARSVIWAAPSFIAAHVVEEGNALAQGFEYAPWMVANVLLDRPPATRSGAPLSWDNVSYNSRSLGYIYSQHQVSALDRTDCALTYYQPLDFAAPKEARTLALKKTQKEWASEVVADLETMHPGISKSMTRLDVWVWGHAMRIPKPGAIWNLPAKGRQFPGLYFVHSDQSAISIFEEAFTRGYQGAEDVVRDLGRPA